MPQGYIHVYAVLRIDDYQQHLEDIGRQIKVKEILPSQEEAVAEVERLNRLNADKDVRYNWQSVQYYPDGRAPEND